MAEQYRKKNKNPVLFSRQFYTPVSDTPKSSDKSAESDSWLSSTLILFLLFGIFIILIAFLGEYGILAFQDLKQKEQKLIEEIQSLKKREQALLEEIDALQNNPEYIETLARKELGLIRPDEVIYFLPEKPSFEKPASEKE